MPWNDIQVLIFCYISAIFSSKTKKLKGKIWMTVNEKVSFFLLLDRLDSTDCIAQCTFIVLIHSRSRKGVLGVNMRPHHSFHKGENVRRHNIKLLAICKNIARWSDKKLNELTKICS